MTTPTSKTIGYVDAAMAKRPYSAVTADIEQYANWRSYSHPDDPSTKHRPGRHILRRCTSGSSAAHYKYMQDVSSYAYNTMPSAVTAVASAQIQWATSQYFSDCDIMVEFEDSLALYADQVTIDKFPQEYLGQSAIIIHDVPTMADVVGLVHVIKDNGGGRYLSDDRLLLPGCQCEAAESACCGCGFCLSCGLSVENARL